MPDRCVRGQFPLLLWVGEEGDCQVTSVQSLGMSLALLHDLRFPCSGPWFSQCVEGDLRACPVDHNEEG